MYDHSRDEIEWNNLANDPIYDHVKKQLAQWLPTTEAEDVYILDWPRENKTFWDATLKAAEKYHGKSIYGID